MQEMVSKMRKIPVSLYQSLWNVGREDPRRVLHALKVGIALTLVSFLYLLEPLSRMIGESAMWVVLTVVVVLEFTVGENLCKGLNRGFGTFCAVLLTSFIEYATESLGTNSRAALVGTLVFLLGFVSTYLRFIPKLKGSYDYGVVTFLLTIILITVSSVRDQNVLQMARERLYSITIAFGLCLFVSLFIFPNWSGEYLHTDTVDKIEALASSIEGETLCKGLNRGFGTFCAVLLTSFIEYATE